MRDTSSSCFCSCSIAAVSRKRGADAPPVAQEPVEVGSGDFYRAGPVGLRIDAVRLGKVRMRGMMGQGESKDDVFVVHTRFKLMGDGPVKQPALQRDGGLITFGEGGLKLTDSRGVRFKQALPPPAGFDGVKGNVAPADAILDRGEAWKRPTCSPSSRWPAPTAT